MNRYEELQDRYSRALNAFRRAEYAEGEAWADYLRARSRKQEAWYDYEWALRHMAEAGVSPEPIPAEESEA